MDVIFVEDDDVVRHGNRQGLELAGFRVAAFADAPTALHQIDADFPGVIVSDVRMPGVDGLELFERVRKIDPEIPFVLITGHGDIGMAVDALQKGAFDFIPKPFGMDRLAATLRRACETRVLKLEDRRLERAVQAEGEDLPLIGDAPAMQTLRQAIRTVADLNVDVLILGETGTGKDLIARSLHAMSSRRNRPLVSVNCAAISDALFDAEMFGLDAAPGMGGQRRSVGRIERADRGTLFLDDIQSLSLPLQAKLLRVVEEREVWPVGAPQPRHVDIRIIATGNADLSEVVRAGAFRADLYYRLCGVTLTAPPLRERREDIPLLFSRFLAQAASRFKREAPRLNDPVRSHLAKHDWPGNVRELAHFAERVALGLVNANANANAEKPNDPDESGGQGLASRLVRHEEMLIRDVLKAHQGDARQAMEALQLPRKTFYAKLQKHGIRIDDYRFKRS